MSRNQNQLRNGELKKPKPTTDYQKNKKAFDQIVRRLRRLGTPKLGSVGAMNPEKVGGSPSAKNLIAPTPVDFKADVLLAVKATLPRGVSLKNFILSYLLFDSDDEIECGLYVRKVIGDRMHSVEQRVGAEFIRRGIWPLGAYLHAPRVRRGIC